MALVHVHALALLKLRGSVEWQGASLHSFVCLFCSNEQMECSCLLRQCVSIQTEYKREILGLHVVHIINFGVKFEWQSVDL